MQIVAASHLDHGLTEAQINHVRERFAGRDSFFIESFELPEGLGLCPSGLYGPAAGDAPVEESAVHYAQRGDEFSQAHPRLSVLFFPSDERPCEILQNQHVFVF